MIVIELFPEVLSMVDLQIRQHALMDQLEAGWKNGKSSATFVESVQDYAHDPLRCLTTVAFLPETIIPSVFSNVIHPLKSTDPEQYYFLPDALHMTIKNIRTVSDPPLFTPADVDRVRDAFARVAPMLPPIHAHLNRLLELPTSMGIRVTTDESLLTVIRLLDGALQEAGVPDNKTYVSSNLFFGNITCCRYTHPITEAFQQKIDQLKNIELGSWVIDRISLVIGNSVCHPATRRVIETFPLQEAARSAH
jgi:hypothetical protein